MTPRGCEFADDLVQKDRGGARERESVFVAYTREDPLDASNAPRIDKPLALGVVPMGLVWTSHC